MSANNFGGKTKNIPIPEVVSPQTDNSTPQEAPKPKELSKSQESLKNFILAFLVGAATFLPVWFIMINFVNIPMPRFIHISLEDWNFWISLLGSLLVAGLVLLTANAVAKEKNKWTEGISWVLIIIFTCWVIGYYGHFRKVESQKQIKVENTNVYADNPYGNRTAFRIFLVNEGELTSWVDWPVGFDMKIWGDRENIVMILEDGTKIPYSGGSISNLPNPEKDTRIRVLSKSDNQTVFFYRERI